MAQYNKNNAAQTQMSERQLLESKYNNARSNLLMTVVLTVVNILLLVSNTNRYFLYSAYIPFLATDMALYFGGTHSAGVYVSLGTPDFLPVGVFAAALFCIAAGIVILYVLSWVLSKKKAGWLTFGMIFFVIDTLAMVALNGIVMESILDYVIHAWVVISLIGGVSAHKKLMNLPEEVVPASGNAAPTETIE